MQRQITYLHWVWLLTRGMKEFPLSFVVAHVKDDGCPFECEDDVVTHLLRNSGTGKMLASRIGTRNKGREFFFSFTRVVPSWEEGEFQRYADFVAQSKPEPAKVVRKRIRQVRTRSSRPERRRLTRAELKEQERARQRFLARERLRERRERNQRRTELANRAAREDAFNALSLEQKQAVVFLRTLGLRFFGHEIKTFFFGTRDEFIGPHPVRELLDFMVYDGSLEVVQSSTRATYDWTEAGKNKLLETFAALLSSRETWDILTASLRDDVYSDLVHGGPEAQVYRRGLFLFLASYGNPFLRRGIANCVVGPDKMFRTFSQLKNFTNLLKRRGMVTTKKAQNYSSTFRYYWTKKARKMYGHVLDSFRSQGETKSRLVQKLANWLLPEYTVYYDSWLTRLRLMYICSCGLPFTLGDVKDYLVGEDKEFKTVVSLERSIDMACEYGFLTSVDVRQNERKVKSYSWTAKLAEKLPGLPHFPQHQVRHVISHCIKLNPKELVEFRRMLIFIWSEGKDFLASDFEEEFVGPTKEFPTRLALDLFLSRMRQDGLVIGVRASSEEGCPLIFSWTEAIERKWHKLLAPGEPKPVTVADLIAA